MALTRVAPFLGVIDGPDRLANRRAGTGAGILRALKETGISLAFSGLPTKGGRSQVDLVAEKLGPIQKVARKKGWKLSKSA